MKKNILRFAVSAVAVAAIMLLCVSTYNIAKPADTQTVYTSQTVSDTSVDTDADTQISSQTTTPTESQTTTTTSATTSETQKTTTTKKNSDNKNTSSKKTSTTKKSTTTTKKTTTTTASTTTTTTTTEKQTTTTTAAMSSGEYASAMFKKINSYRTSNGRSSLNRVTSGALYEAAKLRLKEIMSNYSHTRPDGSKSSTVYAEFGLYPNCCAENLAYGSMDNVYEGWIGSSGHRTNILNGSYTQTALVTGYSNGRRYWVQLFIG